MRSKTSAFEKGAAKRRNVIDLDNFDIGLLQQFQTFKIREAGYIYLLESQAGSLNYTAFGLGYRPDFSTQADLAAEAYVRRHCEIEIR